jgi:hypothetical protein
MPWLFPVIKYSTIQHAFLIQPQTKKGNERGGFFIKKTIGIQIWVEEDLNLSG